MTKPLAIGWRLSAAATDLAAEANSRDPKPKQKAKTMTDTDNKAVPAELAEPRAVATDSGVDLLPPATPRDVLDTFVASCSIGQCDCDTTFVSKITGVELFEEPGHLRVQTTGAVTPKEVLAEMASAPQLANPQS